MTMKPALYAATLAHFSQHEVNLQVEAFAIAGGRGTLLPLVNAAAIPSLLLQTVIVAGARTNEGTLIEAIALPWFDIIAFLKADPSIAFQLPWQKWEEIIAGAYKNAGFEEVTLTPRSGDHGRDVIAIKKGICSIRVIEQVKASTPPHLVAANDVRALIGVLERERASKAFLSTTSDFAPRIKTDPIIQPFIPYRLELINGTALFARLRKWRQGRRRNPRRFARVAQVLIFTHQ
jgi:restriction system protein